MKYKICVTNNIEFIEKGIVMENKYAKEAQQESTEKERLVNYEYKTNFKFEVVKVDKKEHSNELETIIVVTIVKKLILTMILKNKSQLQEKHM